MTPQDLARFAELGVATVYEAAGQAGLVDVPLTQIVPGSRAAGPARTVLCGQDDNLMVHAVMAQVQRGEILVITMPEPAAVALVGELLATQAAVRGVAGILVDGSVRDVETLREMGLPIWSRFVRVRGATKTIVGSLNQPITVGGATIRPGNIVVLDEDGAVVVAADRAAEVLQASLARRDKEAATRKQLDEGALSYDLHGLRAVIERTKRS